MNILVLGADGMIGSSIFKILSESTDWIVRGSIRNIESMTLFSSKLRNALVQSDDLAGSDAINKLVYALRPEIIVNCVGLTKHRVGSGDPLLALPINSLLPHRISQLCKMINARLIHISTDCVFSGRRGLYFETDDPDASDLYGRSKALGEVVNHGAITLRTSTIGHELRSKNGLLEWFLLQDNKCRGYKRAIFSGLPTVVFAEIIRDIIIPRPDLSGLYHVAARPINKYDLLHIIASVYKKKIQINSDDSLVIDRSLDCSRFKRDTGFIAPDWGQLVETMYAIR